MIAATALLGAAWSALLALVFARTWGHGRSTFVWLLALAALSLAAPWLARRLGALRLFRARASELAAGCLVAVAALVFLIRDADLLAGRLSEPARAIAIVDVGENTWCAARTLFGRGENPYAQSCQLKSVADAPHVATTGGVTTMYGVRYDYGYPYFPAMFAVYEPLRRLDPSRRSILLGNGLFFLLTWIGSGWLAARLAPGEARLHAAGLAIAFLVCVEGLGREIFFAGHTDGVVALFAIFALVAVTYGRARLAGALFGAALASKLLPGALFALFAGIFYARRPERWRFLGALVLVTASILLPFVLWNPAAFFSATILYYLTEHATGDDTALWFFLPDRLQLPFALAGASAVLALAVGFLRRRGAGVAELLRLCVVADLIFLAFNKMMHLNYLLAVLPLGAAALASASDPRPEAASASWRS